MLFFMIDWFIIEFSYYSYCFDNNRKKMKNDRILFVCVSSNWSMALLNNIRPEWVLTLNSKCYYRSRWITIFDDIIIANHGVLFYFEQLIIIFDRLEYINIIINIAIMPEVNSKNLVSHVNKELHLICWWWSCITIVVVLLCSVLLMVPELDKVLLI